MIDVQAITDFLTVAERLESEPRLTRTSGGAPQMVASHSWNMAMMAMAFRPYLQTPVDMGRVIELCLIHDLPEAICHDVPYHTQTPDVRARKAAAESAAIEQINALLGDSHIQDLFAEYEARQTPESKLAKGLDIMDTGVQHMCARDLKYICDCQDGYYWRVFFSEDYASLLDFEPVLRTIWNEIRRRAAARLRDELDIDAAIYIKDNVK